MLAIASSGARGRRHLGVVNGVMDAAVGWPERNASALLVEEALKAAIPV
jgi:hypothetical protein